MIERVALSMGMIAFWVLTIEVIVGMTLKDETVSFKAISLAFAMILGAIALRIFY